MPPYLNQHDHRVDEHLLGAGLKREHRLNKFVLPAGDSDLKEDLIFPTYPALYT